MSLNTKALFVPSGHFCAPVGIRRHFGIVANAGISGYIPFSVVKALPGYPVMYQKIYKDIVSSLMEFSTIPMRNSDWVMMKDAKF